MRYMFLQKSLKKYYLIQHFLGKVLTLQMFYDKIFSVVRYAQVAELADAQDLKSCGTFLPCRFDPDLEHHVGAGYILLAPIFVYKNQSVAMCRCSAFFAKGTFGSPVCL